MRGGSLQAFCRESTALTGRTTAVTDGQNFAAPGGLCVELGIIDAKIRLDKTQRLAKKVTRDKTDIKALFRHRSVLIEFMPPLPPLYLL